MKPENIGSSLSSFLEEEGIREDVEATAIKRVLAWEVQQAMEKEGLNKTAMAERMETSRAALDRLLDPENTSITLKTMQKAAAIVGKRLQIELISPDSLHSV
ncbi:MAG: Fis family transcriptional regulator [Thermosynechococcaceae cyanobacterium]